MNQMLAGTPASARMGKTPADLPGRSHGFGNAPTEMATHDKGSGLGASEPTKDFGRRGRLQSQFEIRVMVARA